MLLREPEAFSRPLHSKSVICGLQDAGREILRLKDYFPTDAPDGVFISKAKKLDAILISLNGDFADIAT
ncbi:MAG: hypothetical protein QGH72_01935 [Dehalococcoidia bacterium]|nr:hypothetical protein [Dehalococcoidia bacterium]